MLITHSRFPLPLWVMSYSILKLYHKITWVRPSPCMSNTKQSTTNVLPTLMNLFQSSYEPQAQIQHNQRVEHASMFVSLGVGYSSSLAVLIQKVWLLWNTKLARGEWITSCCNTNEANNHAWCMTSLVMNTNWRLWMISMSIRNRFRGKGCFLVKVVE